MGTWVPIAREAPEVVGIEPDHHDAESDLPPDQVRWYVKLRLRLDAEPPARWVRAFHSHPSLPAVPDSRAPTIVGSLVFVRTPEAYIAEHLANVDERLAAANAEFAAESAAEAPAAKTRVRNPPMAVKVEDVKRKAALSAEGARRLAAARERLAAGEDGPSPAGPAEH